MKEESNSENSDPPLEPLCLDIPDADIILRSSDQVNFRVHKSLLALSSSFFKAMLSLPQPPDREVVDGLPVVSLSEDAGLLNSLVSLLYPIFPVKPSSYEEVYATRCLLKVRHGIDSIRYSCGNQTRNIS